MKRKRPLVLLAGLLSSATFIPSPGQSKPTAPDRNDWPMLGGAPHRNAVSAETGIPHEWDVESKTNIKWTARLGNQTYGTPVIADGKIYVGTNNSAELRPHSTGDKGCLLCLDQATGELLWQATHDKLASGAANDWPEQGVASNPYVDGDRVYYVSNRCELVCADAQGFYDNENDGPFQDEKHTEKQDADFVWILDMIAELDVYPHNLAACSPVGAGELIFLCTSNGVDEEHETPPKPDAPSFIAVNKHTGKIVWKRNDPGENIMHGQWSSPAYGIIAGKPQVVFGGGDGWCYAFEPLTGKPIWKLNLNPKDAVWEIGGTGTKTSIVSTPVIHDDKVFLAVGDDPENADREGHLYAIDATKTGDVTDTGAIWHVDKEYGRTISNVAIADGLLYAAELGGFLSCFDAETGKRHWRHDMLAGVWGSPCVVDGKVMLGSTDGELHVLVHDKTLKPLAVNDLRHAIYSTPVAVGGALYITTEQFLYAIQPAGSATPKPAADQPTSKPASRDSAAASPGERQVVPGPRQSSPGDWPMFRGNPQLTGLAGTDLPEKLAVCWKYESPEPNTSITSTAAIAHGTVYVGSDAGTLLAIDLATGQPKWRYETGEMIESSPTVVEGLVVFGDDLGIVHACDAATGAPRWKFETQSRIVSSVNTLSVPDADGKPETRLIVGSYDGHLYGLRSRDGTLAWKYETEDRVHATAALAGTHALVGGCDGHLHVVNASDGTAVRKVPLESVTGASAAVRGTRAFLGTYGEQVLGIDWQSGSVLWRFEDPERSFPYLSSAALTDNLVLIGGRDKRLHALDPETGQQKWQFVTKGRIDSSPVVVDKRVFFGSGDGNVYALDVNTGEEAWRFETGSSISASPAIGEGHLVISTEDGVIYCFAAPRTR